MDAEIKRQAFEAFKKAWEEYPSQDNEGYVPDRGGFKCGWFAALQWADSTPPPQEGDEEWIDSRVMELMGDGYNTESQGVERAVRKVMLREGIARARRTQAAEIEELKNDVKRYSEMSLSYMSQLQELRALLERAIKYAMTATEHAPELKVGVSSIIEEYERIKESK